MSEKTNEDGTKKAKKAYQPPKLKEEGHMAKVWAKSGGSFDQNQARNKRGHGWGEQPS